MKTYIQETIDRLRELNNALRYAEAQLVTEELDSK